MINIGAIVAGIIKALITGVSIIVSRLVSSLLQLLVWAVGIIIQIFLVFFKIVSKTVKIVMIYIPKFVARFMPKKSSSRMNQMLIYAGVEMTSEEVISITLVYSIVVAVIAYLIAVLMNVSPLIEIIVALVAFLSVWIMPFTLLSLLTNNRAEAVEKVLPEVLSMIAQNMAVGMTSYNALWSAARPEFGPLAVEIQDVAKATLTGIPLTDALVGMTNHIKSTKLSRSVRLIIQGMKSGGDLPVVLESISVDMRMEYNLRKQMSTETSAHALFILFALMIGAPLLFAVSLQFINIFSTIMSKMDITTLSMQAPQSMVSLSPLSITPDFFHMYAIGILFISAFFGALLIGMLRTGNAIAGVPNIPIFVVVSIGIFMVLKHLLNAFFSSFFIF